MDGGFICERGQDVQLQLFDTAGGGGKPKEILMKNIGVKV